jgi:hypothetical protein
MISADLHDELDRLLNECAHFALGARGTTNHCPMTLVALAKMGATPGQLRAHFDFWRTKYALDEAHPRIPLTAENWTTLTGVREAFGSLQAYLSQWVASGGAQPVIEAVLRQVPMAPASEAFHAIIRTGYGLESGNASEIAAGLAAYVAANLRSDVDLSGRDRIASVQEGFGRLSDRFCHAKWPGISITDKLRVISADPAFGDELRLPPMGPDFLADLRRAAIALYWQTADFTVLHMVTGTHAARLLLTQIPPDLAQRFYPALWVSMAAAYVSVGAPREKSIAIAEHVLAWDDILARAILADDDHVVKMVYTSHIESLVDANPLYRAAASRLVRRTG